MQLEGKRVVLTGASSGIGLELLYLLHKQGAKVLAVARRMVDVDLSSVTYFQQDISSEAGVDAVFKQADAVLGGVDVFIANAGFAYYEGAEHASPTKTKTIFDTNVNSVIYSFVRLKQRKGNDSFQFVVTASAISYLPLAGYALYSATKHAIQGFFEAARYELPSHQIITLIHPVATKTDFFAKDTPIPFPSQSAKTVAQHYIEGIKKDKAHIFPSKIFWILRHATFLQPLIQQREARQFRTWRKHHD